MCRRKAYEEGVKRDKHAPWSADEEERPMPPDASSKWEVDRLDFEDRVSSAFARPGKPPSADGWPVDVSDHLHELQAALNEGLQDWAQWLYVVRLERLTMGADTQDNPYAFAVRWSATVNGCVDVCERVASSAACSTNHEHWARVSSTARVSSGKRGSAAPRCGRP